MAIITYTCDTCHRSVDVPQNKFGFEVYRNCIITASCKGTLSYIATRPEYIRGTTTHISPNLPDWIQRLVLYKHTQKVPATTWKIKHNLNNKPDVNVFVYDNNNQLIKFIPSSVSYIDINTVQITLPLKYTGIIECIAKYSNTNINIPSTISDSLVQISNNHYLTFAVSRQYHNPILKLEISSAGVTSNSITVTVPLISNNSLLPWGNAHTAHFNGKNYIIYSIDLLPIIPDNITSAYAVTITSLSADNIIDSPIINHKGLIWILLSNGNMFSDKILTSAIDVTSLTYQNNITKNNITSVNSSIIIDIYPTIKPI